MTFIFAIGAFPIDFATFIFTIHSIFLPENEHFWDSESQNCALLKIFTIYHIFLNFATLIFAIERIKVHFCDIKITKLNVAKLYVAFFSSRKNFCPYGML